MYVDMHHCVICKSYFEANGLWSDETKAYHYQTIDTCYQCKVTKELKDMRMVSLHDISSSFNDRVCIDHLFLGNHVILHFMGSSTRLLHGSIVTSRAVREAIDIFETI